jgi:hemoglobin
MLKKIVTVASHSLVLALALSLAACGGKSKTGDTAGGGGGGGGGETAKKAPLFDRLGGLDGISKVIDMFIANVVADERVNARFKDADAARLRQMLIDQVCEATGGPCKYTGKDMKTAHAGMNLTDDEFGAVVEDLVKALDAAGVPEAEKSELLGALGSMKGDIVGQ